MSTPEPGALQLGSTGLRWLWLSALTILLDQATKLGIVARLTVHESVTVSDFFSIVHWHNTGAAFSFLASQPGWQRPLFTVFALVASAIILRLLWSTSGRIWFCAALALILGGALGNLIDRFAYGYVIDFLLFHWNDWIFPAFNVADSAISVGAAILILDSMRKPHMPIGNKA